MTKRIIFQKLTPRSTSPSQNCASIRVIKEIPEASLGVGAVIVGLFTGHFVTDPLIWLERCCIYRDTKKYRNRLPDSDCLWGKMPSEWIVSCTKHCCCCHWHTHGLSVSHNPWLQIPHLLGRYASRIGKLQVECAEIKEFACDDDGEYLRTDSLSSHLLLRKEYTERSRMRNIHVLRNFYYAPRTLHTYLEYWFFNGDNPTIRRLCTLVIVNACIKKYLLALRLEVVQI